MRELNAGDARAVADLFTSSSEVYRRYFNPFPVDEASLTSRLAEARRDKYWGVWLDSELAGFFMLRGFDQGYAIPAFGVCIRERWSGFGLLTVTLAWAVAWCRIAQVEEIMLKVHPENRVALDTYTRFGFSVDTVDPGNHNLVCRKSLRPGSDRR